MCTEVLFPNIAFDCDGLDSGGFNQLGGRPRVIVFRQVANGNMSAFTGETNGHGATNTAVTPGYER